MLFRVCIFRNKGEIVSYFPALVTISKILRFIAWVLIIIGAVVLVLGVVSGASLAAVGGALVGILGSVAFVGNGILILAAAELIQVLLAIEESTRLTAERVRDLPRDTANNT